MNPKKVLIISYYWPPAGGPGVQRWLKFSKYLPEYGWQPTIYTPENPSYPIIDETLINEIPKDIEIVKTKIWEPYQLAEKFSKKNKKYKGGQFDIGKNQSLITKLSIFVRGNFFIPDARVFWVKPSIRFLEKYLNENSFDALVTTGPPHSVHLIGLGLKNLFPKLHWIADFRDPWTEISYYKHLKLTKFADKLHRKLEQNVFQNADITLATSYTDAQSFQSKGARAICITNGYDDDAIPKSEHIVNHNFIVSYIGVLEQLRNPSVLWEVLGEMTKENNDFENDFRLKLVGKIDESILIEIFQKIASSKVLQIPYLPHKDAVLEMQKSELLLITNFPNQESKGIIPGKIFEYLASGKQIVSFGPKDSDVANILEKTNAGKHFEYSDKVQLKKYIFSMYYDWKNNITNKKQLNIEEFHRRKLTEKLCQWIGKI